MKELVLTHLGDGFANIAKVDYSAYDVVVKRVPSSLPILKLLIQSGKLREGYSEVSATHDVWLLKIKDGWISVSCDGVVSVTGESNQLETDDAVFLISFVELPVWSVKSKVFVAKLLYAGSRVALHQYIKVVGKLSLEVASAFSKMFKRGIQAYESTSTVSNIEIWGHTLNMIYGSHMEFLHPCLLCELNWLPPLVCNDAVMWRGITTTSDKTLYVYLKGDDVLYVGYATLQDSKFNRYSTPVEVQDVLTYENLLSPTSVGILEVFCDYMLREDKNIQIKVCNELLPKELAECFIEFIFGSMLLVHVFWDKLINGKEVYNSWLYDVVNNKIHVFKSYHSTKLGTYYGEMTVEEWQERCSHSKYTE